MSGDNIEIITVIVRRSQSGLFTATSDALDGVYVAHRDLQQIVFDMPAIVESWFKTRRNMDVQVYTRPMQQDDESFSIATISIPAEIAAQRLAR